MATQAIEITESQMQPYLESANAFQAELVAKYPKLVLSQSIIDAIVGELKEMGLYLTHISVKSWRAGFLSAVASKKIVLPPQEQVITQDTIDRIRQKYPVVITKEKQLSKKELNALSGVAERGSGRATAAERRSESKRIEDSYRQEREKRAATSLRSEFRKALADAEMLTGRTHSESATLRKEATAAVLANPKYLSVRDSK